VQSFFISDIHVGTILCTICVAQGYTHRKGFGNSDHELSVLPPLSLNANASFRYRDIRRMGEQQESKSTMQKCRFGRFRNIKRRSSLKDDNNMIDAGIEPAIS
jgi:hypothetical protein